mmetsp:Transcript_124462/g.387517  ORF Transcript_124462/g.387517 Transcript_124462/m.387517 type:complete len:242 (+) Transcript_124462:705-1430(+)
MVRLRPRGGDHVGLPRLGRASSGDGRPQRRHEEVPQSAEGRTSCASGTVSERGAGAAHGVQGDWAGSPLGRLCLGLHGRNHLLLRDPAPAALVGDAAGREVLPRRGRGDVHAPAAGHPPGLGGLRLGARRGGRRLRHRHDTLRLLRGAHGDEFAVGHPCRLRQPRVEGAELRVAGGLRQAEGDAPDGPVGPRRGRGPAHLEEGVRGHPGQARGRQAVQRHGGGPRGPGGLHGPDLPGRAGA